MCKKEAKKKNGKTSLKSSASEKTLDAVREGRPLYLALAEASEALLLVPLKGSPNLSHPWLLPCLGAFARAVLSLDKLFLQPNVQLPSLGSCPPLPYVSLPCQTLTQGRVEIPANGLNCRVEHAGSVRTHSASSACCRRTGI